MNQTENKVEVARGNCQEVVGCEGMVKMGDDSNVPRVTCQGACRWGADVVDEVGNDHSHKLFWKLGDRDERMVDVFGVPPPGHTSVLKFPVNDDVGIFTTYIVVTIMSGSISSPYPFKLRGNPRRCRAMGGKSFPRLQHGGIPYPKGMNRRNR